MYLMLVAPTRMGKSTTFCIPNLLEVEGSCIVTNPSGELFACTSGQLAKRGFDVRVLAPADPGGAGHLDGATIPSCRTA